MSNIETNTTLPKSPQNVIASENQTGSSVKHVRKKSSTKNQSEEDIQPQHDDRSLSAPVEV